MKFKRLAALLTALILAVTMFAACGQKPIDDDVVSPGVTLDQAVTNVPDNTLATTAPVTEPPVTTTEATTPPVTTVATTTEPVTTTEATTAATTKADPNDFTVEQMTGVMYATMSLNVRKGPSTDFDRIGALSQGEAVNVTGRASTGWYQIDFKGSTGYVSNIYMTSEAPSQAPSKPSSSGEEYENLDEESESIDEGGNGGSTAPQGGQSSTPATPGTVTAGSWVSDNGATYMYNHFTEDRYKQALNKIAAAVQNLEPRVDLSDCLTSEEAVTFRAYILPIVGTEYCYLKDASRSGTTFNLNYYVSTAADAQNMMSKMDSRVSKIVNTISGYSDYNKAKYIYEWIALNSAYEHSTYADSAYGPIVAGNGTCMGYAKAGFLLLAKAGFDCVYEVGESGGYSDDGTANTHIWVKTQIKDRWVNIDFGWADPSGNADPKYICYDFLCVSDQYIRDTRPKVFDLGRYYESPNATTSSYSWYSVNDLVISSASEARSAIKAATKDAINKNSGDDIIYVRVQFDTVELLEAVMNDISKSVYNKEILKDITSKYTCETRIWDDFAGGVKITRTLGFKLVKK